MNNKPDFNTIYNDPIKVKVAHEVYDRFISCRDNRISALNDTIEQLKKTLEDRGEEIRDLKRQLRYKPITGWANES